MYDQISLYMESYRSPFLCGFRKGLSTQYCIMVMLEKWRNARGNGNIAGAVLTDLSKAFDCLDHELLVAKLEAYGFDFQSLAYIYSYLSHRKQRTKVNKTFSAWSDIKSGVPEGSILGPLLFNVYVNDMFYFVGRSDVANYVDDTTPYTVNKTMDARLNSIENDTSTLTRWFYDNYLKMNVDKCHLLVSSHEVVSITVDQQVINCSNSVRQ